jgi:hypothetical protein
VGYVQQSFDVETIRTVQQPNDSKRKADGGPHKTGSQKPTRKAEGRADSRKEAEQVRVKKQAD